jgi:tagatose-1,6-bisphosphate aldolase
VEVVGCAPNQLMPLLSASLKMVTGMSVSTKRGLREMGAQLYGMLLAYTEDDSKFNNTLADLTKAIGHKVRFEKLLFLLIIIYF